jgi:hypothetical protein
MDKNMEITIQDTVQSLVVKLRDDRIENRQAAINGAKTNMGKLIAAGVITTCDDEMNAAFKYDWIQREAAKAGISCQEMERIDNQNRDEAAVIHLLQGIVLQGETHAERTLRLQEATDALTGWVMENGKKCKHKHTKKEWGMTRRLMAEDTYLCHRCGATMTFSDVRAIPTETAQIAGIILANANLN